MKVLFGLWRLFSAHAIAITTSDLLKISLPQITRLRTGKLIGYIIRIYQQLSENYGQIINESPQRINGH
jgi:hypothetical protein